MHLETASTHRLTLILVPDDAGRQRLHHRRATLEPPAAWVTLTAADNTPEHFLTTLITALKSLMPAVQSVDLALPPEDIVVELLNALFTFPDEALLLLTGYEVITTPAVHETVAQMLNYLPPQWHLIIITRDTPPLPNLPRLRACRQLQEVRLSA
ncbi:MAG: hypothetical protein ACP5HM_00350 [Anaerolineae bacterium]